MFFIANVLLILARDKERKTKGNRRIAGAVVLEYRLPATSVSVSLHVSPGCLPPVWLARPDAHDRYDTDHSVRRSNLSLDATR
jgi:hypothetical protein